MSSCSYIVEYSAKKVQEKFPKALAKWVQGWYTGLDPPWVFILQKDEEFCHEKAAFC
jgi:hypothetical protein